ncbi:hypothetical protein DSLASN_32500 [Desulfoluna limicola]|uniref:Uncharacterized protein n=1 Tax=Desulfoluna limicola TaxID=2810562 RepID=A0ABM7PJ73_9BACT|nr:hypothetical protein DSLASN_32500 [Desulfoluna limicola]
MTPDNTTQIPYREGLPSEIDMMFISRVSWAHMQGVRGDAVGTYRNPLTTHQMSSTGSPAG